MILNAVESWAVASVRHEHQSQEGKGSGHGGVGDVGAFQVEGYGIVGCRMWDMGCAICAASGDGCSRCLFSDVPEDTSGALSGTLAV